MSDDIAEIPEIGDQGCPVPERGGEAEALAPTDLVHVPHRKRMAHAYVTGESGQRELAIYYGSKEVSFDEEHLFAFGETLVRQTSFVAGSAAAWGPGYTWDEIRPLFEALLAEGILKRGEPIDDPRGGGLVASRLPPSQCPMARTWSGADCESITRDLGGRAVEIGNLEALLSVYRIAHPALDADDRQVGEANTFPPGLRLDRETEWRVCQYPGSRYRDEAPMNVTALKAMIKHWKPMMLTLLAVRSELRQRLARSRDTWTVGDLHLLAGVVLALPAYLLMLRGGSSPQPPLHPVLSSLFRITDGIRMTTHLMLFLSEERTRRPDEPTSASDVYDYAERNGLFLSSHGVCAGPRLMIEEFLAAAVDGTPVKGVEGLELPAEIQDLLGRLPEIVDYALLGLQSWAVSRSIWLATSRAYRALRDVLAHSTTGSAGRLRGRLEDDWATLNQQRIADRYEHDVHVDVYTDTYEQSWRALRSPVGPPTLAAAIAPVAEEPHHVAVAAQLRALLGQRLAGSDLGAAAIGEVVDENVAVLMHELREEQAILDATEAIQSAINSRLERPEPRRPLTARDLRVHFAMYGGSIAEFTYLFDTVEHELGIRVDCSAHGIAIADLRPDRASESGPDRRPGHTDLDRNAPVER